MNPLLPANYLLILCLAIIAGAGFVAWRSAKDATPRLRLLITLCRICALILLAIAAFNPGSWQYPSAEQTGSWAFMADSSASMATEDTPQGSRWEQQCRWSEKAESGATHKEWMKRFTYGSKLNYTDAPLDSLKPAEQSTDINGALHDILAQYRAGGSRLAGIILAGDGRQTTRVGESDPAAYACAEGVPVYGLCAGGEVIEPDLSLQTGQRRYIAFKGQRFALTFNVRNRAMGPLRSVVTLLDPDSNTVETREIDIGDNDSVRDVFYITADKPGYHEYTLEAASPISEQNSANNHQRIGVIVLNEKVSIFMAEGTPNWNSKFLAQLLRNQSGVKLDAVYRISPERFFRIDEHAAEAQQVSDKTFPDSAEELGKYSVVMFGKGAEYFLTPERLFLLRKYVAEQGGSVLFFRGKPYSGEFEALAELEPVTWGSLSGASYKMRITDTGRHIGLLKNHSSASDPELMPALESVHSCRAIHSFSRVMAEGIGETGEGSVPIIVTRRIGRGMITAVNTDSLWQWDFSTRDDASKLYRELWLQVLFWCALHGDFAPGYSHALAVNPESITAGGQVHVQTRRRDDQHTQGAMTLTVKHQGSTLTRRSLNPSANGTAQTYVDLPNAGLYKFELSGTNNAALLAPPAITWAAAPPTEHSERSSDRENMRTLCERTGGSLITEDELPEIIANMEAELQGESGKGEPQWEPWWDSWWLLLIIVLPLGIEWFVRRRHGLL